jgi:hypothetical protein
MTAPSLSAVYDFLPNQQPSLEVPYSVEPQGLISAEIDFSTAHTGSAKTIGWAGVDGNGVEVKNAFSLYYKRGNQLWLD